MSMSKTIWNWADTLRKEDDTSSKHLIITSHVTQLDLSRIICTVVGKFARVACTSAGVKRLLFPSRTCGNSGCTSAQSVEKARYVLDPCDSFFLTPFSTTVMDALRFRRRCNMLPHSPAKAYPFEVSSQFTHNGVLPAGTAFRT